MAISSHYPSYEVLTDLHPCWVGREAYRLELGWCYRTETRVVSDDSLDGIGFGLLRRKRYAARELSNRNSGPALLLWKRRAVWFLISALLMDILVDGLRGVLARTHGQNHGGSAGHGVAACVHAFARGQAAFALHDQAAAAVGFQPRRGGADERVGDWCRWT